MKPDWPVSHTKLSAFMAMFIAAFLMMPDAKANLISNGSFEVRDPAYVGPYLPLYTGDASISGWTVTGEGIDYVNTFWPSQDGIYNIDLNGSSSDDNTPGGLSQAFATQIGTQYQVSFWLGANGGPSNPQNALIGVQTGSSFFGNTYTIPWSFPLPGTWTEYGFDFVAEASTSTIKFESLQLFGDGGITVDNVAVEEVPAPVGVPEPATLALIGMALLSLFGFGMMHRRAEA